MTTNKEIVNYVRHNPGCPTFVVRAWDSMYSDIAVANREKLKLWCEAGGMLLADVGFTDEKAHPHTLKYRAALRLVTFIRDVVQDFDVLLMDVDISPVAGPHVLKPDRIEPRKDYPDAPFARVNPNCRVMMAIDAHGLTTGAMLFRVRGGNLPLMKVDGWQIEEDGVDEDASDFMREMLHAAEIGYLYEGRLGEQCQVRSMLMNRVPNKDFGVLPEWVVANPSSEHTFRGDMSATHALFHHWESANRKIQL
jgi:hypothetical protein